jgi:hypothetical protein
MNALKVIRLRDALRFHGYPDTIEITEAMDICRDYHVKAISTVFAGENEKVSLLTVARYIVLKGGF